MTRVQTPTGAAARPCISSDGAIGERQERGPWGLGNQPISLRVGARRDEHAHPLLQSAWRRARSSQKVRSARRSCRSPQPTPGTREGGVACLAIVALPPAVTPHALSNASPPNPRSGGGALIAPGVRENRGATAGCTTPKCSSNVLRAFMWWCFGASAMLNTGAKHASVPSSSCAHSSRGF